MPAIRSDTVKGIAATVPPPRITGQLSVRRWPVTRVASQVAATTPTGFPIT
jgi:hypothetical protein